MESTPDITSRTNNRNIPMLVYYVRTLDGRCFIHDKAVQPTSIHQTTLRLLKRLHAAGQIDDDEYVRQTIILRDTMAAFKGRFNDMLKLAKALPPCRTYAHQKAWREKRNQQLADEKKYPKVLFVLLGQQLLLAGRLLCRHLLRCDYLEWFAVQEG
jgi:hypothetical protein